MKKPKRLDFFQINITKLQQCLLDNKAMLGTKYRFYERDMYIEYAVNPFPENQQQVEFDYFDGVVLDSIYTFCNKCETNTFSTNQILRTMSGNWDQVLSGQPINERIQKLMNTDIVIYTENEFKKRNILAPSYIYGKIIPCEVIKEKGNDKTYKLNGNMPTYTYAALVKQIASPLYSFIDTQGAPKGKVINNTTEWIMIKHFLAKRFANLSNDKNAMSKSTSNASKVVRITGGDSALLSKVGKQLKDDAKLNLQDITRLKYKLEELLSRYKYLKLISADWCVEQDSLQLKLEKIAKNK